MKLQQMTQCLVETPSQQQRQSCKIISTRTWLRPHDYVKMQVLKFRVGTVMLYSFPKRVPGVTGYFCCEPGHI